jgi:hypothetical protein
MRNVLILIAIVLLSGLVYLVVDSQLGPESDANGASTENGSVPNASTPGSNPPVQGQEQPAQQPPAQDPSMRLEVGPQRGRMGIPPKGLIQFPDGTWLPAANGVTEAAPFPGMPGGAPYSPVVAVFQNPDDGTLWFRHANGAHSSLQMRDVNRRGVIQAESVWIVGNPREGASSAKPVVGEQLKR